MARDRIGSLVISSVFDGRLQIWGPVFRKDGSGALYSRWKIRQSALFLCLLAMVLLASLIISCGGASNSMVPVKPGCTGRINVVGDWQGSLFSGSEIGGNVAGTIDSSGNAVFFDSLADIVIMNPMTGTCSFSATATVYSSIENGIQVTSSTATGNVNSATSISGTLTGNPMTLSSYNPMGTGSPQPISGNTIAEIEGQRQDQLSLALSSSNGNINFSGTDVTGTISEPSGSQSFVYAPYPQGITPTALNSSMTLIVSV